MKKAQLFVILLVVMLLLALADYHFNTPGGLNLPNSPTLPAGENGGGPTPVVPADPNLTQKMIDSDQELSTYRIDKRTRSLELFETFDLTQMTNMVVYKNVLFDKTDANAFPLYVYEIQSASGQGKVTFLNLKLAITKQTPSSEAINETNQFGQASFFYNDPLNPTNGFLLVQINDNIFGFKYFKTSDLIFQDVQRFISVQTSLSNQ